MAMALTTNSRGERKKKNVIFNVLGIRMEGGKLGSIMHAGTKLTTGIIFFSFLLFLLGVFLRPHVIYIHISL